MENNKICGENCDKIFAEKKALEKENKKLRAQTDVANEKILDLKIQLRKTKKDLSKLLNDHITMLASDDFYRNR